MAAAGPHWQPGAPAAPGCLGIALVAPAVPSYLFGMETDTTSNPCGLEPMLGVSELAAYLGVPVSTVYDWRTRGLGPRAYRFGKHLKFAVSDVRIWIEQQRELDPREQAGR